VIVQARKGSNAPFALLPGLVLHQDDGAWTPEAEAVLRRGSALALSGARL
jgi:tRNA1(Val) A37 N6-methylase TrmN6